MAAEQHASSLAPATPRRRAHALVLCGLWLVLYGSFTLFRPPLLDDADSVHAEAAREMLLRHDPVTLYANGIRYLEKAPLLYWSMAASFAVFGPSDWAARLPLALFTLGLFLVVYALGRRMFRTDMAGLYGALVLLTSFGVFIFTRILIPDAIVCLWLALAILFFWRSLEESAPSVLTASGFAAACALNVLTKGLIGLVFPVVIVLCFLVVTRNLGHLRRWHPWIGLLVFLALAAPWHIAAGLANPTQGHPHGLTPTPANVRGFFWFYFVNEHLLRYLNLRVPRDYDTVPLLLFWGLLLVWLMPWCAFLPAALRRVPFAAAVRRRVLSAQQQAPVLLAVWAAVPLLFFSFSTRQEYYVLPSLPPLALLIGMWLAEDEQRGASGAAACRIAWFVFAAGWIGAAVALLLALGVRQPRPGADLASVLKQNTGEYALSFGHFLDLGTAAMAFFRAPLLDVAAALLVGTLGHLFYRYRGQPRLANAFLAGMSGVFLLAAHMALITFAPVLSSATLARAIRPQLRPEDLVVINGEYESGSTLGFYLRRQVHILNGRSSNLWYGSFFPDAPQIFESNASFSRLWAGPQRVFLWTEPGDVPRLPTPAYTLAAEGGKEILSNQAALQ